MRTTVAVALAVVVAVLAVVTAGAAGSVLAWVLAVVLVAAVAAAAALVRLPPAAQRALVAVGALVGLAAIVLSIAEIAVRGYRTDSSATLLGLVVGLAGALVLIGVLAGRTAPAPAPLWQGAAAVAALGLVGGLIAATTVPFLPLSRAVTFTAADPAAAITLDAPEGVTDGDTLVAQVLRAGPGEITAPEGWTTLRTTALPDGAGSVSLFTATADAVSGPVTFDTDAPTTLLGGIAAFSHIASVESPGESIGSGGDVSVEPAPADGGTQVLYFVAAGGVAEIAPPEPLAATWQNRVDNVVKATAVMVTRPALADDADAPLTLTPSAPLAPWVAQTVVLQAR